MVRLSLPGVGERLAMNLALLAYFRVLSEYGPIAIAAYTVGLRILSFAWMPGIGFGVAAATLVGQALGTGQPARATRAGWRSVRMAFVTAVVLGTLCAVGRTELARLFTSDASSGGCPRPVPIVRIPRSAFLAVALRFGRCASRRRRHIHAIPGVDREQLGASRPTCSAGSRTCCEPISLGYGP